MTYLENSPQVVAGAGQTGIPLKVHRYAPGLAAPLLAMLLCLGLTPGTALADTGAEPPAVAAAAQARLVNINTADAAALAAGLQGVGLSRAEDIIRYRETYGPFGAVEELVDVKGIGQATLDKNRTVITLE
ncbi:helix-hairpin-helix domain-containing protein [Haliea sp. E1-2-M8]|uniref:helix-hairpin-helix domain-containing protein n=1 Tax=Haliea sp. E1-2-M8 TaxID=3064706 RepID=UPI00271A47F9|nr:helix-hairpin-helix domain-containing protein [Haliea sp. E1-2-M8]MDO8862266.1 helix-hairpin-helix domain-containing protein [Haliea sp. E1-2-M8]